MPFIVTTKRPDGEKSELAPCTTLDGDCACNGPRVTVACTGCVVSRVAVATLEEAQREARTITLPYALVIQPAADKAITAQIDALAETGGTITLPDATVEVEPTTNAALYEALDARTRILLVCDEDTDEVVAAWNARKVGTQ